MTTNTPKAARAALSPDEARAVRIQAAKVAGAAQAKKKLAPIKHQPDARPAATAQPGAGVVYTRDTTKRETAAWQRLTLAPDPRYPSFAAAPLGIDPATGKPWEARA